SAISNLKLSFFRKENVLLCYQEMPCKIEIEPNLHIGSNSTKLVRCHRLHLTKEQKPMQGLMMDYPLTLQHAFDRAIHLFPRKEIVTQTDAGLHRYTYREWGKRTAQLAHALQKA